MFLEFNQIKYIYMFNLQKRALLSPIFLSKAADNNIRYSIIQYVILILDLLIGPLLFCLVKEQNNENIHNCEITRPDGRLSNIL